MKNNQDPPENGSSEPSWQPFQQELTRKVLYEMDIAAFTFQLGDLPNKGCMMEHLDGRYGYITLADASSNQYPIYDYQTDALLEDCATLDQVIQAGWKVST